MAIVKGTNGLSLNVQHDYITLRTPNGNYTTKWSGSKATGKLATHKTAFTNIDKYVQEEMKNRTAGEAMQLLLDTKVLSTLWSEWNQEVKPNSFVAGNRVKFESDSMFSKKYPSGGIVKRVDKKTVYIYLLDKNNEACGFDYQTLVKI